MRSPDRPYLPERLPWLRVHSQSRQDSLYLVVLLFTQQLVCLPLCDSLLKAGAGCFPGELNVKRLFRGLQVSETKRGYFFGWGGLPRWIKPPGSRKAL